MAQLKVAGIFRKKLLRTAQAFRGLPLIILTAFLLTQLGCNKVQFSKDPGLACQQGGSDSCLTKDGKDFFDYKIRFGYGTVDILFVNDNSASMSFEQARLSGRFQNFIQELDSKSVDYRIGVITTDVSSASNPARAVNKNGQLQDGRLIDFGSGNYFLTPQLGSQTDRIVWFNNVINRQETLTCEQFIVNWIQSGQSMYAAAYSQKYHETCPTGDERGIYAALLTIRNNPQNFLRSDGHLALVILSDEDVRSQLYPPYSTEYDLSNEDKADTLISEFASKFQGSKDLTAHAIITASQSCLNVQNAQTSGMVAGSYGYIYHELAQKTGGRSIDICNDNYTTQLGSIAKDIILKVKEHHLKCASPQNLIVSPANIQFSIEGQTLKFSATTPENTEIGLQYSCESL